MRRNLLLIALGFCIAAPAGAVSTQRVHARLVPVASTTHAAGTFSARGVGSRTVTLSWQLSVSRLSGPAKKATLKTSGPSGIVITLCRPCSAKAHGKIVMLGSAWRRIAAGGGFVVVTTRAHPRGELRGALQRG
jgi:CHRD domain-containing protein